MKSMQPRRYPGQISSLAGYRLLAHELMGLRYDPDRSALEEARALAARFPTSHDDRDEGEDERALMWLHRSRDERIEHVRFSDEAPPALVWEEVLREEQYWRGTLE